MHLVGDKRRGRCTHRKQGQALRVGETSAHGPSENAGEVTFDPANSVIPFPNDVLLSNGKVSLPNPKTGAPLTPADCPTATMVPPPSRNFRSCGSVVCAVIVPT